MALKTLNVLLCLVATALAMGGFMGTEEHMPHQNGNIVIKMDEGYLSGQKQLLFRDFVKELEKFHLSDVTIRQKTESARLTAYMNQISLHSINLKEAEGNLTFGSE